MRVDSIQNAVIVVSLLGLGQSIEINFGHVLGTEERGHLENQIRALAPKEYELDDNDTGAEVTRTK